MNQCECSDEYGPCEDHGETLVIREGAGLRTADELTMILIEDLVSVGAELSVWGRDEYNRLSAALSASRNPKSGTAWFDNPDDGESARDLSHQLENYVADLWVIHDDGYRIVRPFDNCPLAA